MNERFLLKSWHVVIYVVVALLGFSIVTVYSTDISTFHSSNSGYRFTKHLLWILTGGVALAAMANVDYHYLRKFSIPILATAFILLVLVIMPGIRVKINGAYRWIRLTQMVGIQPSEFAKLAVIIFLAGYIEK